MLFSRRRMARRQEPGRCRRPSGGSCSTKLAEPHFGLNFDPSHLIWQHIDSCRAASASSASASSTSTPRTRASTRTSSIEHGILGLGWHTPKLPGLGDVDWGQFFAALTDAGYRGPVCIEVEDRAYEGSLADRKRRLRQSKRFLEQWV